jgi:hypothetical protein
MLASELSGFAKCNMKLCLSHFLIRLWELFAKAIVHTMQPKGIQVSTPPSIQESFAFRRL